MRRLKGREGSTSIFALTLLVLVAAAAAGGVLILQAALSYVSRSSAREQIRLSLWKEGQRIVGLLASDPTPASDSPLDPVWAGLSGSETPGMHTTLEDVSSRLNANWVQKSLFQETMFAEFLQPGRTAQDLQQRREDKGITTDIASEYGDIIKEDALSRYFSGYCYANLNTTDEFALRKLYAIRMADQQGAEVFRTHWQQMMIQKKTLKRSEVRDFLGVDYGKLFPLMNAEPSFNVHFMDALLLTQILSIADLKIPKPAESAQLILGARDRSELTLDDLPRMIGAKDDNMIYQYLGVTTWFWKIIAARGVNRLEMIVARVPSDDGSAARFLVTEERYLP